MRDRHTVRQTDRDRQRDQVRWPVKAAFGTGKVLGKVSSGICRLPNTFVSQGRFIPDPPGSVVTGQRFKSWVCGCVCVLLPVSGLTTRVLRWRPTPVCLRTEPRAEEGGVAGSWRSV